MLAATTSASITDRVGPSCVACDAVCSGFIRPAIIQVQIRYTAAAAIQPAAGAYFNPAVTPMIAAAATPTGAATATLTSERVTDCAQT